MNLIKLSAVMLIIAAILVAGCATKTEYIKIPPSKIFLPPIPPMEDDIGLQYKILKQGQTYIGEQGGGVCFPRSGYESLKVHLKQIKLWMDTVYKVIDQHNQYVDKAMDDSKVKKGWW